MSEQKVVRAVFLDRDGTINEDVPYLRCVADLRLLPGAGEAIARLNAGGWLVIVTTNQSGVARGYFSEAILQEIHDCLVAQLQAFGAHLDAIFYCPHHPADGCTCRKPQPGLVEQAVRRFGVDPAQSWVVGDKASDVEMGQRAGCRTVLLVDGDATELAKGVQPSAIATDLRAAVEAILCEEEA